ncbi:MAG: AEC family transporter [Anaerolineae bacterium]
MTVLINVVLPIFAVAGLAALAQARLHLDPATLSRAAFYLFAPALVLDSLTNSDVGGLVLLQMAAVIVALTAILWVLGALVARLLRREGATQAAFLNAILLVNAGNYGLPVNLFAFGSAGLARAALYLTVNSMLSSSVGVYLGASSGASARTALKRVARVPLVYAAAVGLIVNLAGWTVPEPLAKAIALLGQASVPVMLAMLGITLAETFQQGLQRRCLPALGAVTVLRLVVSPLLAFLLAGWLGLDGLARDVTVLESAMPSAVMTIILASEFEADHAFAALCVLGTTLGSLVTVTILLNLL